jgi:RNA polymerase sigma factor for flagellar operon FliA
MTKPPSAAQRDETFILHQGLVRAIAWKIHQRVPRNVDLDDLVAYGQIGLLEAIAAFDARRGRKFTTYAWHRIRGAMLDGLGKMVWFDRAAYERGHYECAAAAACGPGDAPPARRPAQTDLENVTVMSREPDAGEASLHFELVMFLRDLLTALPEKEAILLRGTFFEGRTLTEAARRVGISTAWASRLQTRTLADLRIALERGGFG